MIKEDFVSYEVAKLLEEKGFEILTDKVYDNQNKLDYQNVVCWQVKRLPYIFAPTHQMAMAWLREEKNIHIDLYYLPIHRKYMWSIVETKDPKGTGSKETYEEAVEAALKYTLENLLCN